MSSSLVFSSDSSMSDSDLCVLSFADMPAPSPSDRFNNVARICAKCLGEISRSTRTCPHCNRPIPTLDP